MPLWIGPVLWRPALAPGARQIFTPDGYPSLIQTSRLPRLLHSWNTCSLTSWSWGPQTRPGKALDPGCWALAEAKAHQLRMKRPWQSALRAMHPPGEAAGCSWRADMGLLLTPARGDPLSTGWGCSWGLCLLREQVRAPISRPECLTLAADTPSSPHTPTCECPLYQKPPQQS